MTCKTCNGDSTSYGLAPHYHPPEGGTVADHKDFWPECFEEDEDCPGCGIWHCPDCGPKFKAGRPA